MPKHVLFAILQKYEFSSKSQQVWNGLLKFWSCLRYCKSTSFQANHNEYQKINAETRVVCDTAKVRVFKQITTQQDKVNAQQMLFAILQKYEFSSKSQPRSNFLTKLESCLRYCKSTSFQANHNSTRWRHAAASVVCDTAKVRVFKQITTGSPDGAKAVQLFAILQKYEFSSKSQQERLWRNAHYRCLRYCKSTSFQANHN